MSDQNEPQTLASIFADKLGNTRDELLLAYGARYCQMTGYLPDEVELRITHDEGSVRYRFVPLTDKPPRCTARSVDLLRDVTRIIGEERDAASPACRTRWVLAGILEKIRQCAVPESMMLGLPSRKGER